MKWSLFLTALCFSFPAFCGMRQELCENPGFEENAKTWKHASAFGGASGSVRITDKEASEGKRSLHFHKDDPPKGAIQIFGFLKKPGWNGEKNASVQLSLRHKGRNLEFYVRFFTKDLKPIKSEVGKPVVVYYRIPSSKEWSEYKQEFQIPKIYMAQEPCFRLQLMMWGKGDAYVDDVSFIVKSDDPAGNPVTKKAEQPEWLVIKDPPSESTLPPVQPPPFRYGEKDGYLTKDGKPHFYTGNSTFGGGQYSPETIWLARLLNYSMVTLDWGINVKPVKKGDKIIVSWPDPASSISMFRELSRNGLIVEHDTGNAAWVFNPFRKYVKKFPHLLDFITTTSHFYSYDHNTEIGRRIHFNGWKNRYRYLKGLPIMATEVYNELGYTPSHKRVVKGFREYAKEKYGTLEKACEVWKKEFKSWDEVYPPHLGPDILPGRGSHGYRKQMLAKYWQMHYDWLRFTQLDLVPGLREMKKLLRTVSDTPFLVDWRGHRNEDDDGYAAADPDLLEDIIDINGLHHSSTNLFDYAGENADERSVLASLSHNAMHFDFVNSNNGKVTINPECIVSRTSTPGTSQESMRKNSFKNFSSEWKFKLESDKSGVEKGYFKPEFDDSKWDVMKVPGCWDETARYRDRKGFGWYRTSFKVPARLKADFEDGSRRFCIYGKGVAQKGTVWVNGIKVGEPQGWSAVYKYDVSPYLNYGKENQITFLVDGSGYANGLRFFVHVLPEDRISSSRLLGKKEYASFLWSHMMHGASGVVIWHWDDPWRPFMAEVNRELDRAGGIAMPAARHRKAKAAMLMPFLFFRGLPTPLAKYFRDYMAYYAAMMFRQVHTAILTEKNILKVTPEQYRLVLYPFARIVHPETFRHFRNYVENGGTAVVSPDSLKLDYSRYGSTGLEKYLGIELLGECEGTPEVSYFGKKFGTVKGDMCGISGVKIRTGNKVLARYADGSPAAVEVRRGKGRVIFIAANLSMEGLHALLGNTLKECGIGPDVEIADSGDKSEFPYLEAQIAGDRGRFLLYLHNWGGKARTVSVKLPFAGEYSVRNVRFPEEKQTEANNVFQCRLEPTGPGAWIFERKDSGRMPLKPVSAFRTAMLKKLDMLLKNPAKSDPNAAKVLFIEPVYSVWPLMPLRLACPNLTAAFQAEGAETWGGENLSKLTLERMKEFRAIVLMESHIAMVQAFRGLKAPLVRNLLQYVKEGGNLFVFASSMNTAENAEQSIWWQIGPVFKFSAGAYLWDDGSCGYGDPYQIKITEFGKHPAAKGLKEIQMFVTREFKMSPKCRLEPVLLNRGRAVMIGGKYGSGNVLFATDFLWMQPTRAEIADNAKLLGNVVRFLLNKPVEGKKAELLLTEPQIREMESEEK